jgi:beta-phosphoglucomutase-like phosphatase (HAD superfamily)
MSRPHQPAAGSLGELGTTVLLCDADGNLFPSEQPAFVASADVTNAFLEWLGAPQRYTAEELRLASTGKNFRTTAVDLAVAAGAPVEETLAARHPAARTVPAGGTAQGRVLTAADLERWVQEEKRQVTAHLATVLRPDPEVLQPLTRLAENYLLSAVSSSATARLAACFTATGIAALIPEGLRFSAEDSLAVPTSKPDPAVYLLACEQVGIAPDHGLAVEDSVPGAQSAVAAGIPTVGNLQFVPPDERAERAGLLRDAGVVSVVSSWGELEGMLAAGRPGVRPAS